MLLSEVVACSGKVAATSSRRAKTVEIATLLARVEPGEARVAVSYLAGEPLQRRLGIGWASIGGLPAPASQPSLSLGEVNAELAAIEQLSGVGANRERRDRVGHLLAQATAAEQRFLIGLMAGELRQGALRALVGEAASQAAQVPPEQLRRAAMLAGDLVEVAAAALAGGEVALRRFRLEVGKPVLPMLAQSAASLGEALERARPAALEWKLDGVRIQVHRSGERVQVFTRTLEPITQRTPEVVEAVLQLPARELVLDGELIALRPDGRPRPFQETSARVAFRGDPGELRQRVPLHPFFFDLLHLDGRDLIDLPTAERIELSSSLLPAQLTITRLLDPGPELAEAFLAEALSRGHEGVVVKSLASPYLAGRRGAGWIKVKPRHTLDLVVLAAEWGHGRRQGLLSNLHLGALDEEGGFVMLGKTFKGLTDETLRWQTEALLGLETGRSGITVRVRPELVVEVAFDGVQTSPQYPGGVALRFARVVRYRDDKRSEQADTLATVRQLRGE